MMITKEELARGTKIWCSTPEISEAVQLFLIAKGFHWGDNPIVPKYTQYPAVFVCSGTWLGSTLDSDRRFFDQHPSKEIFPEQLLLIKGLVKENES